MTDSVMAPEAPQDPPAVIRWWTELETKDRGGRAELRRCASPLEVAFCPAYHRLVKMIGGGGDREDLARIAVGAAVLAHVRTDLGSSEESRRVRRLAKLAGTPSTEGGAPRVSETRFRHLLRTEQPEALQRELIRLVRMVDGQAPVEQLFRDIRRWDEATRLDWARSYFLATPANTKKE